MYTLLTREKLTASTNAELVPVRELTVKLGSPMHNPQPIILLLYIICRPILSINTVSVASLYEIFIFL